MVGNIQVDTQSTNQTPGHRAQKGQAIQMATTTEQTTPEQAQPTKAKATPRKPKATKPPVTPAKPGVMFAEGATVYANHPRLHPAEGQATVLTDFHETSSYVKLAWLDGEGVPALVHKLRVTTEPTPTPEPQAEPKAA
jgi:hypothetical protein